MIHFLQNILRTGFPDLSVEILDQVAEGDLVTTRKAIHATHSGDFMGIPPTGKKVIINVIDIIRLREGKYVEHWGMSNIPEVIAQLSFS
jgi:predicted ester cyclase